MTYSFSDSDIVLESSDSKNLIVLNADFNDLTASNIGESSVVEESRRESRSLSNAGRVENANQDVVVEQSLNQALL
jgi:hypothetical protein